MTNPSKLPLIAMAGALPGQVGIVVRSLDESLAGWGSGKALDRWSIWTYSEDTVREMRFDGRPYSMRIALGGAQPQVELIEPLDGPSIYHLWLDRNGPGLHHLGFYVNSLQEAIAAMTGSGLPPIQWGYGTGPDGTGGFAYFDTVDSLGYYLEAIEVPTERRPPEGLYPNDEGPGS